MSCSAEVLLAKPEENLSGGVAPRLPGGVWARGPGDGPSFRLPDDLDWFRQVGVQIFSNLLIKGQVPRREGRGVPSRAEQPLAASG